MAALIKWTDGAVRDIEAIAAYIAEDSEKRAKQQVQRFFERVAILEQQPSSGHPVREAGNAEIRELRSESYRIIYRMLSPDLVHILTVYHSKRLLPGEFLEDL